MNSFKIYTPNDKFYLSNNLIVYSLLGLFLLPITLEFFVFSCEDDTISTFSGIMFIGILLVFLVSIALGIAAVFRYKPLRGSLDGEIVFENDRILINNKTFKTDLLTKMSISVRDHKGMYIGSRGDLDGRRSQGVDNSVSLYRPDKKNPLVYYFQLDRKDQLKDIREQLIHYHLAGKLHFLQLIDILDITRYEDIQEFKREIGEFK